jgi:lysyl-tRNA synthetase class 2
MSNLDDIRQTRLGKLELLKQHGIDPYPAQSRRDFALLELIEKFETLVVQNNSVYLVGRIMSIRSQGALSFFNIFDGTAKFQCLIKQDEVDANTWQLFVDALDIGDFIEVHGTLFITKRGEKTLQVQGWKILSKSLLPLPEKWHGLQDVEERFRKRYLDILSNEEVKARFIVRSKIISEIRKILDNNNFLEVETPMLQPIAGGTNALPFITHHNALDIELFLRIAPELYLKRLLVAGLPKIYEISRNFRNEGIDVTHNPEFTMLEFYETYTDKNHQMAFVELMLKTLVKNVFNATALTHEGENIDFSQAFIIISYADLLKQYAGIEDMANINLAELTKISHSHGVSVNKADPLEKIIDNIYKKTARPKLIQPTFIVDYPVNMLPLAKRSEKDPNLVDAFQLIVGGIEIVKGFSELNDPIDQRARFEAQEANRKAGDTEAQAFDTDFVESLEYGMPPAGGVGVGIDRLVMLLLDMHNIKEVILFPTMRPK